MVICRDRITVLFFLSCIVLCSCSVSKRIAKSAKVFIADSSLINAHTGISIYDVASNKYLFNYQEDKYFVPASNTKIPTCYAAMKYLGDSLVGLEYATPEDRFKEYLLIIKPTGDPTFLHPDFNSGKCFDFIKRMAEKKNELAIYVDSFEVAKWGSGWSWDDYLAPYMAERNAFPMFGNIARFQLSEMKDRFTGDTSLPYDYRVHLLKTNSPYFDSIVNWGLESNSLKRYRDSLPKFSIERNFSTNSFYVKWGKESFSETKIPFVTNGIQTSIEILEYTFRKKFGLVYPERKNVYGWTDVHHEIGEIKVNEWHKIKSQPTDFLLKPMMHRSDNFFAEQTLLMVSNEMLGVMNDSKIIDTLLKTDFKDIPQKPIWADGSGLSRYNLFTPQDFIFILNKMKDEFGMKRVQTIFPTGNTGTLEKRYKADSSYVFAKTGTLSGVVALSGFLYTKKNKLLIFSVLVNNHNGAATEVRNAIEKFISGLRGKY